MLHVLVYVNHIQNLKHMMIYGKQTQTIFNINILFNTLWKWIHTMSANLKKIFPNSLYFFFLHPENTYQKKQSIPLLNYKVTLGAWGISKTTETVCRSNILCISIELHIAQPSSNYVMFHQWRGWKYPKEFCASQLYFSYGFNITEKTRVHTYLYFIVVVLMLKGLKIWIDVFLFFIL